METTSKEKIKSSVIGKGWDGEVKIITKGKFYREIQNTNILETEKYDVFKFDLKNRPVSEEKIYSFMKLFKDGKNFMKEFPVIVDNANIILDGQHRFEACKRLGLPIYFRYALTLTLDSVVDVQVNAGWKTSDYLHSFIKQGNQDYIILNRFVNRYKFNISIAANLLKGTKQISLHRLGFYEGTFRVKDESRAHEVAKMINEISENAIYINSDGRFISAIMVVVDHPDFEKERLIDQIKKYASLLKRQVNTKAYISNIEEVYNYKLYMKNKVRFI